MAESGTIRNTTMDGLSDYNSAQINEIMRYWQEMNDRGRPMTQNEACFEWIKLHAASFQLCWKKSSGFQNLLS